MTPVLKIQALLKVVSSSYCITLPLHGVPMAIVAPAAWLVRLAWTLRQKNTMYQPRFKKLCNTLNLGN
jgi:hypothetical protein